jgi:Zn-finger nucleic acid-binding protein
VGDFSEVEVEVSEADSAVVFQVGEEQREAGKGIKMICPKCKVAKLRKRKVKGKDFGVEYCLKCKGIWFDRNELVEVMPEAIKELGIPRGAKKDMRCLCPKCSEALYAFEYPQTYVTVDMCKKCGGLWFDRDEFKEIRTVRSSLEKWGEMQEYAEATGAKGALIDFIDSAMKSLPASIKKLLE